MKVLFTFLTFLFTLNVFSQTIVVVKDADLGADTVSWTKDNVYHLDGYVILESGGLLNIEAGTVIKGLAAPSTGDVSSALIIARGAKIMHVVLQISLSSSLQRLMMLQIHLI